MAKSHLNEKEKLTIIELKSKNAKIITISKRIKRNESTVRTFLKRYRKNKTLVNRRQTGRPRKLTPKQRRRLLREAKINRRHSVKKIRSDLGLEHVCESTINRALVAADLKSYIPVKKPKLNKEIISKRLKWVKEYQGYTAENWENWIFSDESSFTVGYTGGQRVRRGSSEKLLPQCTDASVKWGTKIFFWGAFFVGGVSDLVFIDGTMDSELYTKVLEEGLMPMFERHSLDKNDYVFQEDGDPKHQSKFTKKWKQNQGLRYIENWPPHSPDLNPIENLWAILKVRTGRRKPSTVEDSKQYLLEEWRRLEADDELSKLIHSMPQRCREVIKAKGSHTKY